MAQSVSNDALWEKLLEMDKKLDRVSVGQKSSIPNEEQAVIKDDFKEIKDNIITEVKGEIRILGLSNDSHFAANRQNIERLDENIRKVLNIPLIFENIKKKPLSRKWTTRIVPLISSFSRLGRVL